MLRSKFAGVRVVNDYANAVRCTAPGPNSVLLTAVLYAFLLLRFRPLRETLFKTKQPNLKTVLKPIPFFNRITCRNHSELLNHRGVLSQTSKTILTIRSAYTGTVRVPFYIYWTTAYRYDHIIKMAARSGKYEIRVFKKSIHAHCTVSREKWGVLSWVVLCVNRTANWF